MSNNDNPAEPFKKALAWLIGGCLCVVPVFAIAQQTEAEHAPMTERGLSEAEVALKVLRCPFAFGKGQVEFGGEHVDFLDIATQQFLRVVQFDADFVFDGSGNGVDAYPLLPFGGIGFRDICEPAIIVSTTEGDQPSVVALRLRPSLDVFEDYPSSADQIRQNRQLLTIPNAQYLVFALPANGEVDAVVKMRARLAALPDDPTLARDRVAFWASDNLYVPMTNAVGDK